MTLIRVNIDTEGCENIEHRKIPRAYLYTCKECYFDEEKRGDEPYYRLDNKGEITQDHWGQPVWCVCPAKCNHNTFTCTICWQPVAIKNGKLWYADNWTTLKSEILTPSNS